MELLKCEGIGKIYGKGLNQVTALDGIDLSVERGEFLAIVGASGSGSICLESETGSHFPPPESGAGLPIL